MFCRLVKSHPRSKVRVLASAILWDAISLGHHDESPVQESLQYLLAPPYCMGALCALYNEASSLFRDEKYLAEQVLISLLKMHSSSTSQLSQMCTDLLDAFLRNHCTIELAGNTIIFAIETFGGAHRTFVRGIIQQLYRIIEKGMGTPLFRPYAEKVLGIDDFEKEWVYREE